MGFLDTASAWLDSTLAASDGQTVTYSDGTHTATPTAVIGQTPAGSVLGDVLQSWQTEDFLIAAADIVLNSVETKPIVGHQITATVRSSTKTFQVSNADDGRCCRYTGPDRRTLRIHTKEIG